MPCQLHVLFALTKIEANFPFCSPGAEHNVLIPTCRDVRLAVTQNSLTSICTYIPLSVSHPTHTPLRVMNVLQARTLPLLHKRFFGQTSASVEQYPYFIPRNTQGNLPVYTDVRNGGSRYLVLIRNIDGNANVLAQHLSESLFERNTPEASRLSIEIVRSKNLVITGGRWKNNVVQWLREKGF